MSDSQKHETIADIIAKKRARANRIERNVAENLARGRMTSGWFVRDLIASIREEADRLEAAWKREKAEIEAVALNVGAVVATTEKSSAVGNAAAMREALMEIKGLFRDIDLTNDTPENKAYAIAVSALSAPARNCDVGTAEEQAERYGRYCDKFTSDGMHCETCPCCGKIPFGRCEFAWSQMPYEDGGAARSPDARLISASRKRGTADET